MDSEEPAWDSLSPSLSLPTPLMQAPLFLSLSKINKLKKKARKISNKKPSLHLQELENEQQTKPKISRRKEIIKIRPEMNDIET